MSQPNPEDPDEGHMMPHSEMRKYINNYDERRARLEATDWQRWVPVWGLYKNRRDRKEMMIDWNINSSRYTIANEIYEAIEIVGGAVTLGYFLDSLDKLV